MSTYSEATEILINAFVDNVPTIGGTPLPTTSIKVPNAKFKKPKDSVWSRLTVLHGESQNIQVGPIGRTRQEGIFVIDMFYPTGTGRMTLNSVQDQIVSVFKKKVFDDVYCKTIQPLTLGVDDSDSKWYRLQIQVFFEFDDC